MKMVVGMEQTFAVRPVDGQGRALISVQALLEWAFAVERASLDYDEIGEAAGRGWAGVGGEHHIGEMLSLGFERGQGVCVDRSFGRSQSHDDADIVASVLRASVSHFGQATWVASLARNQSQPKWDLGQPRLVPIKWSRPNHHGVKAKSEVLETVTYKSRRRGVVKRAVMWTPCTWHPSVSQVGAARRSWLEWWTILFSVKSALEHVELERFSVTDAMPPRTPWKNTG